MHSQASDIHLKHSGQEAEAGSFMFVQEQPGLYSKFQVS